MNKCFLTWGVDTQKGDRWATWLEGLPHCVRGGRTRSRPLFTSPHEASAFSTSSPARAASCLVDDSHSGRCEVVSQSGFDLYFNMT